MHGTIVEMLILCMRAEPRTIISGLVEFVPLEQMQVRSLVYDVVWLLSCCFVAAHTAVLYANINAPPDTLDHTRDCLSHWP